MIFCKQETATGWYLLVSIQLLQVLHLSIGQTGLSGARRSSSEMLRLRGYIATDHYLTTSDGYALNVVHAKNPLVNSTSDKDPILFVHGIMTRAAFFLANPEEMYLPKDYSGLCASQMSRSQLEQLLAGDLAANSLVYLALNFGHEVWMLNRRGTPESRLSDRSAADITSDGALADEHPRATHTPETGNPIMDAFNATLEQIRVLDRQQLGELTLGSNYWNYSLDEQAKRDIPETVTYVLEKAKRDKLALVGHSAGGALAVMALTVQPDLADKLSKVLLWAPAVDLGNGGSKNMFISMGSRSRAVFESYIGPFPLVPSVAVPALKAALRYSCETPLLRSTACIAFLDGFYGPTGSQLKLTTDLAEIFGEPLSSHEYAQIMQTVDKRRMHFYDYGRRGNLRAYGRVDSPVYDVLQVKSRNISVWYGRTDTQVTPEDVEGLLNDFSLQRKFINKRGVFFNHIQFTFHSDVSRLLNIPSLQTIEDCRSV